MPSLEFGCEQGDKETPHYILTLRSAASGGHRSELTKTCVFRPNIYEFPIGGIRTFPAVRQCCAKRRVRWRPHPSNTSRAKAKRALTTKSWMWPLGGGFVSSRFVPYRFVRPFRFISFRSVPFRFVLSRFVSISFRIVSFRLRYFFVVSFRLTSLACHLCRRRTRALSPYPWERWRTTCTLCFATKGKCYEYNTTVSNASMQI